MSFYYNMKDLVPHVSTNLVEIFKQEHIMNIVSIKRMPGDDCEDKTY